MDYSQRLAMSYYETIATINELHKIYLVKHKQSNRIFVKKLIDVYNINVYENLYKHPVIGTPRIIDFLEIDNQLVLIEEYISGTPLHDKINSRSLNSDDIIKYMLDLCNILETLHAANPPIIHRDIKPTNIIITSYNNAVLLDFNAAKQFNASEKEDTVLLGTQGYAAPEQYGFGASSPQTDIYSLGIVLKEMMLSCNLNTFALNRIVDKCMKLNPNDRYASIADLKHQLNSLSQAMCHDTSPTSNHRFVPPGYRTCTPWKMFLASGSYIYISWLFLTMNVKNTFGVSLWLDRIFGLIMTLLVIFVCTNYLDVQDYLPFCNNKNRLIKYFGIVLSNVAIMFFLAAILLIIKNIFHM